MPNSRGFPAQSRNARLRQRVGTAKIGAVKELTSAERRALRARAHHLKPVVIVGETVTYQIVGDDEGDIKDGKISISSPLARALIGKTSGDVAEVQAPGGVREYEILDVKYV